MASLTARTLGTLLEAWRGESGRPAYLALAERIRLLILDGRVPLGTRLPAEREVAAGLGISRTTVSAAYTHLRQAGYLDSLRGSGSVARLPEHAGPLANGVAGPRAGDEESGALDFSKAMLPATPGVAAAAIRAAEALPAYLGLSGFDPVGLPVLREAIAERYSERGLPTDADEVMVTIGAQHAIALISRVLLSRGDRALIESPTYPHAIGALRDHGARLVGVNVSSEDGWDQTGLEQAMQRTSPTLAYLMPDLHNPTGLTMPEDQRVKTVELAATSGTQLVIDETMAQLTIDDVPEQPPFAVLGREGARPILLGSLGKSSWGGLRIGWIRAERSTIQRLVQGRNSGDLGTPILEQLIATDLLSNYQELLDIRRHQLRIGRDHLLGLLAERLPEWHVPVPPGGLTAWVNLGAPVSSQLTIAARNEGLLLAAGPRFGFDGAFERFLRIPFSYPNEDLDRAVGALERAWQSARRYDSTEENYLAAVV